MKALRLQATNSTGPGAIDSSVTVRSKNSSTDFENPRVELEDVPLPTLAPNDLLLKVQFCGLCGSDFHMTENHKGRMAYPGLTQLPVTIGHEFSGLVVGYGNGTNERVKKAFPLQLPVTSEEMVWCGECPACRSGHLNHCEQLEELGFTRNGAHAEFIAVPAKLCWSLADLESRHGSSIALKMGAMVEPYAVSYRALFQGAHRSQWMPGLKILLVGAGPIGLAALDLALLGGALLVDVLEQRSDRKDFALELGARSALFPEQWREATGQYDWIIDAAGATDLCLEVAKDRLAIGGTICAIARSASSAPLDAEVLITKNARIVGTQGHSGESTFGKVIELMAHQKIRPLHLLRRIISLEAAVLRLKNQEKCEGKILVSPSGGGLE
jgi:scyllo-inosose 3-dehydrogenase